MARIQGQVEEHSKLALSALSWISNAVRPLRLNELQHALAVRRGDRSLDEEALADETLIISVSAGLITFDTQSGKIRLVHFTVEEYFRKRKQEWFPDADSQIAEACLTYLLFDFFGIGRCSPFWEEEWLLQENCLQDYAAQNWGYHAQRSEEPTVEELALKFLNNESKVSSSSRIMFPPAWDEDGQILPHLVSGVHLAAQFGLTKITKRILESRTAVDLKDSKDRTPLSLAATEGHETIVKLLVDRDDVVADSTDSCSRTSLSYAAQRGHETIVKLLIDRDDVTADSQDMFDRTPLSYAALEGYEALVKLLVDRDDVIADSWDVLGYTPLSFAAQGGHEAVVKLLVNRDDVIADSQNYEGRTPLSCAAEKGYEAVLKLLIDRGDVITDSRDKYDRTPLLHAAALGHQAVVELLVDRDDVAADSQDNAGRTPLSYAAENGHQTAVELLVDRDDVAADSRDEYDRTPLSYAAENGHQAVVKLLEEKLKNNKVEE